VLTYLVVLLEGIFIIGSFSYLGAYIEHSFHFNNLYIGLIMTAFGLLAVIGGRLSGKLAARLGRKKVLLLGLFAAALADIIFTLYGANLAILITGVGLLGLGFMLAHSTLLTIATEFDPMARGSIMSLVAFCFMGGGGVGTALGGRLIAAHSYAWFFSAYAIVLAVVFALAATVVPATIKTRQQGPCPVPERK
jgi:predicted MFS family arabinose efflux permease